jgi:hypothetical protein
MTGEVAASGLAEIAVFDGLEDLRLGAEYRVV